MNRNHVILFVSDQQSSEWFYMRVLGEEPVLSVPGMTEFALGGDTVLGLMPEAGIRRLLGDRIADPAGARGVPRAEVYLVREDATAMHARALEAGGRELSPALARDWGHVVSYVADPDGHILALAAKA